MISTHEITLERPVAVVQESGDAPIKAILFVIHEDSELESRLQAALTLARACTAHLHLLHVIPVQAYTVSDVYGGMFASGAIADILQREAAKTEARLETQLAQEDVSWSYEVTTSLVVPELLKNGALADLVFISRQPAWHEFGRTGPALLGELVCSMRTPLCVLGDRAQSFNPFGAAAIAWNGSIESANAVRSAIGLLRMAKQVRVVRLTEEGDASFPDVRLLEYLSRHGVSAELECARPKRDAASAIVDFAVGADAEYLVMGGYSHSRAGEYFFGGVTRELLQTCPVSLVLGR